MSLPVYRLDLLHNAYCITLDLDLAFNMVFERYWFEAAKLGILPEDLPLLLNHLKRRIKDGVRQPECLKIKNLVGSDEAIADSLNQIAQIKSTLRKRSFCPDKASVLRSTGRDPEPETKPRHISEVFLNIQKQ
jgi:hypothetical protein